MIKNKQKYKKEGNLQLCHNLTIDDTLEKLKTSLEGLDENEVKKRQQEFGKNTLPGKKTRSIWLVILQQLNNPLIYVLIIAGLVSLILKKFEDAIFIFIFIILNVGLGSFQEYRAEKSAYLLQDLIKITSKVIRKGNKIEIPADELVPGDIILLESGDKVRADIRIINATNLTIDESILTGESVASEKNTIIVSENTTIDECSNIAFAGTKLLQVKPLEL